MLGLTKARYSIFEGSEKVGEATREALAEGVDLTGFPGLSTNKRAAEVLPMVAKLRETLDPSWLEAVGHGPPVGSKAAPLDEAKAKAASIEAKIRDLARPKPIALNLVPVP